jgi:hypothetical protein
MYMQKNKNMPLNAAENRKIFDEVCTQYIQACNDRAISPLDGSDIKPNYTKLAGNFGIDHRTAKNYWEIAVALHTRKLSRREITGFKKSVAAKHIQKFYPQYDEMYAEELASWSRQKGNRSRPDERQLHEVYVTLCRCRENQRGLLGSIYLELYESAARPCSGKIDTRTLLEKIYLELPEIHMPQCLSEEDKYNLLRKIYSEFHQQAQQSPRNHSNYPLVALKGIANRGTGGARTYFHLQFKDPISGTTKPANDPMDKFNFIISNREIILLLCEGLYLKSLLNKGSFIKNNIEVFRKIFELHGEKNPQEIKDITIDCFGLVFGAEGKKLVKEINQKTLRWYLHQFRHGNL